MEVNEIKQVLCRRLLMWVGARVQPPWPGALLASLGSRQVCFPDFLLLDLDIARVKQGKEQEPIG